MSSVGNLIFYSKILTFIYAHKYKGLLSIIFYYYKIEIIQHIPYRKHIIITKMNYQHCFVIVFFILLIYILTYSSYDQYCSKCMYNVCPSDYIVSKCYKHQLLNDKLYRDFIQNTTEGMDEITKVSLYANIYGLDMASCIASYRKKCAYYFCGSSCSNQNIPKSIVPFDNIPLVQKDKDIISKYSVEVDKCILNTADFSKIYSDCHISLFREKCLENHLEKVKRKC